MLYDLRTVSYLADARSVAHVGVCLTAFYFSGGGHGHGGTGEWPAGGPVDEGLVDDGRVEY